jgi:hypothetical protein
MSFARFFDRLIPALFLTLGASVAAAFVTVAG